MSIGKILITIVWFGCVMQVSAQDVYVSVPMHLKSAKTYYVTGQVAGNEPDEFMVDTGSSYTTINESTLGKLQLKGASHYLRDLIAIMADGNEIVVPVYRISNLAIGGVCVLDNVEVAVFPAKTRQILGLSALSKASPFQFSVNPPVLRLSNCQTSVSEQPVTTDLS